VKVKSAHLLIVVFSLVGVISLAVVDVGRTSPGPLTSVHGSVAELSGKRSCSECHGGWGTSMSDACIACHASIGEELGQGAAAGLHGGLQAEDASRCARCHSEHHGPGFDIVNVQSFAAAGSPDPDEFDHLLVDFHLDGEHLELACSECHVNAEVDVLAAGERRFRGLDRDCASCHEDAHEGRMQVGCARCHGQEEFGRLRSLGHEVDLPLLGGHADLDCRTCHAETGYHSLERMGRELYGEKRVCLDCHTSPHEEDFLAAVADLDGLLPEASCALCHEAEHTSFEDQPGTTPERHALAGFPLDGPHAGVDCADCHRPGALFARAYPGREADDCSACHADVHQGQFRNGPFAGGGCLACHDRHAFDPPAFGLEEHALTALPLEGRHAEIDCAACHDQPHEDRARIFRGTPTDCERCHADAHEGAFDRVARRLARPEHGDCARCHVPSSFADVDQEGFDHDRWTGFAVTGAHAQAACTVCHVPQSEPDALGRTFGRVEAHFGDVQGCVTCHVDPHEGSWDAPGLPARVEGREGCVRCHVETSFRSFPDGFDHLLWTGFPADGAHAEAGCSACHTPLRTPDAVGRTWGRATETDCAACHESPHAGQFEVAGTTDCRRCHDSAVSFGELSFRHALHSRFPLGEAHIDLACSACHVPDEASGVVRYRPLGAECTDCHTAQEMPLLRRRGGRR
jgi:hypothetical protein